MQKRIFMELFSFFQEYSEDNGTIFNELSEKQIDMQCDYYFFESFCYKRNIHHVPCYGKAYFLPPSHLILGKGSLKF